MPARPVLTRAARSLDTAACASARTSAASSGSRFAIRADHRQTLAANPLGRQVPHSPLSGACHVLLRSRIHLHPKESKL